MSKVYYEISKLENNKFDELKVTLCGPVNQLKQLISKPMNMQLVSGECILWSSIYNSTRKSSTTPVTKEQLQWIPWNSNRGAMNPMKL